MEVEQILEEMLVDGEDDDAARVNFLEKIQSADVHRLKCEGIEGNVSDKERQFHQNQFVCEQQRRQRVETENGGEQ